MKKRLIIAVLVFFGAFSSVNAQNTTLTGTITGLKSDSLSFSYSIGEKIKHAVVPVKEGRFVWTEDLTTPVKVRVMLPVDSVSMSYNFYAEPGELTMVGNNANRGELEKISVTGSKSHDIYQQYLKQKRETYAQYGATARKASAATGEEKERLAKETEMLKNRYFGGLDNEFVIAHPESVVSVDLLAAMIKSGTYEQLKGMYDKIAPNLKESIAAKSIAVRIATIRRGGIGQNMVNFALNDYQGKKVQLSDFKGKYVLVDFWASWCKPCRAENPNVLKAYNEYKDRGFTVVGISIDDSPEAWVKAIKEDGMPWTQVRDRKDRKSEIMDFYGISAIPSTFLLDPTGKIIASNLRGSALDKKLEEIFKAKSK